MNQYIHRLIINNNPMNQEQNWNDGQNKEEQDIPLIDYKALHPSHQSQVTALAVTALPDSADHPEPITIHVRRDSRSSVTTMGIEDAELLMDMLKRSIKAAKKADRNRRETYYPVERKVVVDVEKHEAVQSTTTKKVTMLGAWSNEVEG